MNIGAPLRAGRHLSHAGACARAFNLLALETSRRGVNVIKALLCGFAILITSAARADKPTLTISADQPLRFGSFVVPTSGSRTVSANGNISDSGLFAVGSNASGPAQFTVTYDRGNESGRSISISLLLLLASSPPVAIDGVSGTLSAFDTDLPGIAALRPGQAAQFTMSNCVQRRCSQTFRVGGRLDVSRSSGGATLVIPLPVNATLLAVF